MNRLFNKDYNLIYLCHVVINHIISTFEFIQVHMHTYSKRSKDVTPKIIDLFACGPDINTNYIKYSTGKHNFFKKYTI